MIKFANGEDTGKIIKIVDRAYGELSAETINRLWPSKQSMMMDISACHANGNPLKLDELLVAKEFDFTHDICGIAAHMNRETGKLEDCFSPRYSA